MRIPAYCSLNFIEAIVKKSAIDFMDPDSLSKNKNYINAVDLILNGLSIKTDCTKEELDEKFDSNPFIKHLMKGQRINPAKSDFKTLRLGDEQAIHSLLNPINLFLLNGFMPNLLAEYSSKLVSIFLAPNQI